MSMTVSLDGLLQKSPGRFSNTVDSWTQPVFAGLALMSWVLGEALMAPVLRPFALYLFLGYLGCFYLFTAWYFRASRLFPGPWTSYAQALPPMTWALAPLHLVFPAALLCLHAGFGGLLVYEIVKAGVVLAVLTRLVHTFQYLNHWPRWSALALVLSPLAVALTCILMMVAVGGIAIVALVLKAFR